MGDVRGVDFSHYSENAREAEKTYKSYFPAGIEKDNPMYGDVVRAVSISGDCDELDFSLELLVGRNLFCES